MGKAENSTSKWKRLETAIKDVQPHVDDVLNAARCREELAKLEKSLQKTNTTHANQLQESSRQLSLTSFACRAAIAYSRYLDIPVLHPISDYDIVPHPIVIGPIQDARFRDSMLPDGEADPTLTGIKRQRASSADPNPRARKRRG